MVQLSLLDILSIKEKSNTKLDFEERLSEQSGRFYQTQYKLG